MKKFFTHLSAKAKFTFFAVAISVLLLGLSLSQYFELKSLKELSEQNFTQNLMVSSFAHSAKYNFSRLDSDLLRALEANTKDDFIQHLELTEEHLDTYLADLDVIKERVGKEPGFQQIFSSLEVENGRLLSKAQMVKGFKFSEQKSVEFWNKFQDRELIYEHLDELNDLASQKAFKNKNMFSEQSERLLTNVASSTGIIILLLLAFFWILNATMINPIYGMIHIFRDIASGNRTRQVNTDGLYLEIGHLAESFNILLNSFNQALMREEAANRALAAFLANMSHELRTPLNSVLGFSSLLLGGDRKSSLTKDEVKWVENIETSGNHLLNLINDVLDLSKIESGQFEINVEEVDLAESLSQVQSLFSAKSLKSGVRLHFENMIGHTVSLKVDEVRLRQILINLINNALKFTEKGSVEVIIREKKLSSGALECLFEIRDTGIGIEKEFQSKIFGSFTQAGADTTKKFGGTGLGLSISKNLVERLGGRIWFRSEMGVGTSFFFTMPVLSADEELEPATKQVATARVSGKGESDWSALNVLVAEDNMMNQELFKLTLKKMGIEKVDLADDGAIALKMAHAKKYDLIFLDMQMPNMDGLQAAKKICSEISNPPPMIALTANAYKQDQDRCFAAGMSDFVAKPINKKELRAAIERQVGAEHGENKAS